MEAVVQLFIVCRCGFIRFLAQYVPDALGFLLFAECVYKNGVGDIKEVLVERVGVIQGVAVLP